METVKLWSPERAEVQKAADIKGLSRHAWMRETLLKAARRINRNQKS